MDANRSKLQGLLLCTVLLLFSSGGYAQQYLLETGAPTFATPEPVPMGFINVAHGNLHIEIPFFSTPQRGGRGFVTKMVYDSRLWKVVDNGSSQSWQPTNVGTGGDYAGAYGWRLAGSGLGPLENDSVVHTCQYGQQQYFWYDYKNYRLNDMDGTRRRFPLYYETTVPCHAAGTTTTTARGSVVAKSVLGVCRPAQAAVPCHCDSCNSRWITARRAGGLAMG